MNKKIAAIALALTCIFAFSFFMGCNKKPVNNESSAITQGEDAVQSENASTESKTESNISKTSSVSDKKTSTLVRPSSAPSETVTSKPNKVETDTSSTHSSGIKQYSNPKDLGLIAYHCSIFWCNSYGDDENSKISEFKEVVKANYFNQYFLSPFYPNNSKKSNMKNLLIEAQLIAEQGGSFWLGLGYDSKKETLKQYEEKLRGILDTLEEHGYRDLVNGIHWDEPYYNNYSHKDLQDQMRINYTVFGLRNFPVFGLTEISNVSPQTNKNGEPVPHVTPEYSKYITDAGYDYYSVDVRDGANNGGAYNEYSNLLGVSINSGKDIYYAYTNKLKKDIGHNFSLWYFPCAYAMPTWAKKTADEQFCMAHLEFMAEAVLKEEYPGGVALYTYHTHTQSHGRTALQERIPIMDELGNYINFPSQEKWVKYFDMVKKYNRKFSSVKYKPVKL